MKMNKAYIGCHKKIPSCCDYISSFCKCKKCIEEKKDLILK